MKRFCLFSPVFVAAILAGCGPSGFMSPELEPEAAARPVSSAVPHDTPVCLPEGTEIIGGPDAGLDTPCCEGLIRAPVYKGSILRLDECEPEGAGHAFCIRCGDGKCSVGENTCSCNPDCRWP